MNNLFKNIFPLGYITTKYINQSKFTKVQLRTSTIRIIKINDQKNKHKILTIYFMKIYANWFMRLISFDC